MEVYLGTGTRTAPRNQCLKMAEIAFCKYLTGHTLLTQSADGIEKAMIFGAQLAQSLSPKAHDPFILMDKFNSNTAIGDIQKALSANAFEEIICWSPDNATHFKNATNRAGHLKLVLEHICPEVNVTNVNKSNPANDLRRVIKVQEQIDSADLVGTKYNNIMTKGLSIIDEDWNDLFVQPHTVCVLPRDCFHASPPGPTSRSLYSRRIEQFQKMNSYTPLAKERLGTHKQSPNGEIACLYTVTSYGLFARNYCDYFSIRKALTSFFNANRGMRVIFPFDAAGFLHADKVTIGSILGSFKDIAEIQFNIFDK